MSLERVPVIVTRSRTQASRLSVHLKDAGAVPLELPTIAIEPVSPQPICEALNQVVAGSWDWVVFTSTNGVRHTLAARESAARDLASCRVAAVGGRTAEVLSEHGVEVSLVPDRAVSEGLLEALLAAGVGSGTRVLLLVAASTRDVIPQGLEDAGATVRRVTVYRTVPAASERERFLEVLSAPRKGYVTFASSSAVKHLLAMCPQDAFAGWRVACIGPITSGTARSLGLEVHVQPEHASIEALAEAIVQDAKEHSP